MRSKLNNERPFNVNFQKRFLLFHEQEHVIKKSIILVRSKLNNKRPFNVKLSKGFLLFDDCRV